MANIITITGNVGITSGNSNRNQYNLTDTITPSGLNFVNENLNLTGSGYTAMRTSSLANLKFGYFYNNDISASITLATGSTGGNILGILSPGDSQILRWNGTSLPSLYAVNSGTGSTVLTYFLSEN